jgi:hypothetical protein
MRTAVICIVLLLVVSVVAAQDDFNKPIPSCTDAEIQTIAVTLRNMGAREQYADILNNLENMGMKDSFLPIIQQAWQFRQDWNVGMLQLPDCALTYELNDTATNAINNMMAGLALVELQRTFTTLEQLDFSKQIIRAQIDTMNSYRRAFPELLAKVAQYDPLATLEATSEVTP